MEQADQEDRPVKRRGQAGERSAKLEAEPDLDLARLGEVTGRSSLYIKRDDLTSPRYGGNKVRKLEWLLADVQQTEQHAVERAVILHESGPITADLLGLPSSGGPDGVDPLDEDPSLEGYLRRFVLSHQHELSETELAKRLGISRKTLWERRQRMGIPRRDSRPPE